VSSGFWRRLGSRLAPYGGAEPFRLESPPPSGPPLLVVEASDSKATLRLRGSGNVVVEGRRAHKGRATLRLEEDPARGLTARVTLSDAEAVVEAPARAVALVARDSSIALEGGGVGLQYASMRLAEASLRGSVGLEPGGGVYLKASAAAVRLELAFRRPGEYWVELDLSAGAVKISSPPGTAYVVEPARGAALRVGVEGEKRVQPPRYTVRVRLRGRAAAVRLA
jgi:hypothetical protein